MWGVLRRSLLSSLTFSKSLAHASHIPMPEVAIEKRLANVLVLAAPLKRCPCMTVTCRPPWIGILPSALGNTSWVQLLPKKALCLIPSNAECMYAAWEAWWVRLTNARPRYEPKYTIMQAMPPDIVP